MINPVGYQVYSHRNQFSQSSGSLGGQSAGFTGGAQVQKPQMPSRGQKVVPGSEQEDFLIDKFGEKKLKELDILPCETCSSRKYQDGSDDPGVSFKTPQHIAPEMSAAMVMSHEREHVVRESASAERQDREVVSQSVTLHNSICPECGKVYVAGGETRTTTRAKQPQDINEAFVGNLIDLKL